MRNIGSLRWAVLAAVGIVPLACSGDDDEGGGPGDQPSAGESGHAPTDAGAGGRGDGASGAGVGGSLEGGSGGASSRPTCTNPQPDGATGLVKCDEGYSHRPSAVTCNGALAEGGQGGGGSELPRADGTLVCDDDESACDAFYLGICKPGTLLGAGGAGPSLCISGCMSDVDCGDSGFCVCSDDGPGTCMKGDCRQNADCGDGFRCASVDMGCGELQFMCQSAADECSGSGDCEGCGYDEPTQGVGVRVCGVQCGRPFLVAAQPRLPAPAARSDWSEACSPRVDHLSESERAGLAAHWTKLGQMEHASIAAFARFSLQLLALGAPPALVDACTAALADETAHAKLCFGIASAYAGHAIGPGPLDVSNSLELSSLADIVDLVILEGCMGETRAALDALESAESATDPVIQSAYARIADDEQRHAELAFRFVQWALERDRATVLPRLHAAAALDTSRVGLEVVGPCLRALTGLSKAASGSTSDRLRPAAAHQED